jgi:hypothetical protein
VTLLPENAFGYVPTPALVAPIEFTMRREDYEALGGHMKHVMPLAEARAGKKAIQNDHILAGQKGAPRNRACRGRPMSGTSDGPGRAARRRAANEHPRCPVARWQAAAPAARPYRPDHRR